MTDLLKLLKAYILGRSIHADTDKLLGTKTGFWLVDLGVLTLDASGETWPHRTGLCSLTAEAMN